MSVEPDVPVTTQEWRELVDGRGIADGRLLRLENRGLNGDKGSIGGVWDEATILMI
jgi:hypothetical protein